MSRLKQPFVDVLIGKHERGDECTLQTAIQAVLDYFKGLQCQCRPRDIVAPLIERATLDELTAVVLEWLQQLQAPSPPVPVSLETAAYLVSWSIFGAATQWSQEPSAQTSAELARDILRVIMDGVSTLTGPAQPHPPAR